MLNADMPTLVSSATAFHAYGMGEAGNLGQYAQANMIGQNAVVGGHHNQLAPNFLSQMREYQSASDKPRETIMANVRRLVQVFIADPDENIPLDQCLLYSGEQKLTDATDQELFFEIDIKGILERHNEKRIKLTDKKVKERTEHLEPAKVRDLKMVVVAIAQF